MRKTDFGGIYPQSESFALREQVLMWIDWAEILWSPLLNINEQNSGQYCQKIWKNFSYENECHPNSHSFPRLKNLIFFLKHSR